MIRQQITTFSLSEFQEAHLVRLKPHTKEMWDTPPDETVKEIKESIRTQLLVNQKDACAYCGLDLGGTSEGQIEHIAPKARYPAYTFVEHNLAMACHYCNGFSKKGNHNTIKSVGGSYGDCDFKLVHPYFDPPENHYGWISEELKVVIQSLSPKAEYSIRILKLDTPKMAELRGTKIIAQIVRSNTRTPQIDDALIQKSLEYRP